MCLYIITYFFVLLKLYQACEAKGNWDLYPYNKVPNLRKYRRLADTYNI